MPLISYVPRDFTPSSMIVINQANEIINAYVAKGYRLTLRQLYYQFVQKGWIQNNLRNYKRLGSIINDARLAGLIDWSVIEDRTRELWSVPHWGSPSDIVRAAASSFRLSKWDDQEFRPEVWIEKEALSGIFQNVCRELDIPLLSCRGYTSQSEMWGSATRLKEFLDNGQKPIILYFGDHDPSGIDMTRDVENRMRIFECEEVEVRRLALNMDQVRTYNPPPNPAKTTDARFAGYIREFGEESWELDALEPEVLVELVRNEVLPLRDDDLWDEQLKLEGKYRKQLDKAAIRWGELGDLFELLLEKPTQNQKTKKKK